MVEAGVNAVKGPEDQYFDRARMEIVNVRSISVRRPNTQEISDKLVSKEGYVIVGCGGSSKNFCEADIEVITKLAEEVQGIREPVYLEVQFEGDENKYPYRDPKYGLETVVGVHNSMAYKFHEKINESAGNPFTLCRQYGITEEKAEKIIAEYKRRA